VPIIDVVRGATSEIEDYVRVSLDRLPEVRISGRAVGDLIHLLAELLENATSFAPPHTTVRVHAEIVGKGIALQVEDRGLGMSEAELAEANLRLSDPPSFDPAHSARLGLLVVAKLAVRQGVTVRLRPSPYGGVTAVVLVPEDLVSTGPAELPPSQPEVAAPAQRELAAKPFAQDRVSETTVSVVDGLPKRVRRANPVPPPAEEGETTITVIGEANTVNLAEQRIPTQRTADEVRSRMSAFQSGTVRGRAHAVGGVSQPDDSAVAPRQTPHDNAPGAAEERSA
jgi:hypothetical protein